MSRGGEKEQTAFSQGRATSVLCVLLLLAGSVCAPKIEPLGKWEGFGGHRAQGSATASSVILDRVYTSLSLSPLG